MEKLKKVLSKPRNWTLQAKELSPFKEVDPALFVSGDHKTSIPFYPVMENHLPPHEAGSLTLCHISHPLQVQKGLPQVAVVTCVLVSYHPIHG